MFYLYKWVLSMEETFGNGRYSIIKKLGEGGKGIVYKCLDNNLNRIVALKLIKGENIDENSYSRIMREAETTARLSHPNIMSIYDMQKENNRFFMVIEYIDGKDLLGYTDGKPMEVKDIFKIIIPITSALSYAHRNGILHRDIKPENIMIAKNGDPKLMDFGLAKALDRPGITRVGTIVGTPAYLSPESALGKESDNRSDLYSLGCVLYFMITGQPPFTSEDSIKLIYSHIHDYPPPPSSINHNISGQLDSIVMKLLKKNPDERFQSADELIYALKALEIESNNEKNENKVQRTSSYQETNSLIGLDPVLEELRSAIDGEKSGSGSVCLITGEAGQGKTRILEKIMEYAVLRDVKSILLKGRESRMSTPNYLFSEMFREYFYDAPQQLVYKVCGDYGDVAVKILPELISKLGRINDYMSSEPEQAKLRFYDGVVEIIKNMTNEYPVLLEIDDINYADSGSLSIIEALMDKIRTMKLVIIATMSRSDSYHEEMDKIIANRTLNKLETHNLDRNQTAMLIASSLHEDLSKVSDEFTDFIFVKTDGNPFYIVEVLKLLKEKKLIFRDERGSWDRKPIEEIGIPSSIGSFIKERLSSLDDITIDLLSIASVIGYEFDVDVLESISGIVDDEFEKIIENSIKRKVVYERKTGPGEFRLFFSNPQLHDYLYENMSMFKKRKLHSKIASTMESLYGTEDHDLFQDLARHYLESGNLQKALDYSIKVADDWGTSFQFDSAVREYRKALEIMTGLQKEGKENDLLRANILYKMSENSVYNQIFTDNDSAYLEEAIRIFEKYGEDNKLAKSILLLAHTHNNYTGKYNINYTENFLNKLYDKNKDPEAIGIASTAIVGALWYNAKIPEAREWGKRYIDYVKGINYYDKYTMMCKSILLLVHPANSYEDLIDLRAKYEEQILEAESLLEQNPDDLYLLGALGILMNNFSSILSECFFDIKEAEKISDKGIDFAGKISKGLAIRNELSKYLSLYLTGNKGIVEKFFDESFNNIWKDDFTVMVSNVGKVIFNYFHNNFDEALLIIAELEKLPSLQVIAGIPEIKIPLLIEKGRANEAKAFVKNVLGKISNDIQADTLHGYITTLMEGVRTCSITGDSKLADKYISDMKNALERFKMWWISAYTNLAIAYYESAFGSLNKAEELMEDSAVQFHKEGFDIYYAIIMYELAVLYHRDKDQEKCNKAIDSALEIFTPLNFTLYIEKCLQLKELLKA